MEDRRIVLVSFADRRYRNAMKRLEGYTEKFPFTERHFCDETNTFDKKYWRKLKPWLYRRGYGYWEWKGLVMKKYLEQLDEGDFLVWSDVGVYWNDTENALGRFGEYLNMLGNGVDVVAFQEPYIEQEWTKGDLLDYYKLYDNDAICKSLQLWSGAFILRKSTSTIKLVDEWAHVNMRKLELETDKRSLKPNKIGFKEHRHDQSSFSLLVKQMPHVEISYRETQVKDRSNPSAWKSLVDYPIQARRHKLNARPFSEVIKNKLLRPWRMFLNFYFRKVRNYEIAGTQYPW